MSTLEVISSGILQQPSWSESLTTDSAEDRQGWGYCKVLSQSRRSMLNGVDEIVRKSYLTVISKGSPSRLIVRKAGMEVGSAQLPSGRPLCFRIWSPDLSPARRAGPP